MAGLLAVHDAYGPDLIGYAEFLLASRPADAEVHLGDEAAEAVLDALLAATGVAADLSDPARMRAWLLAFVRNECLRRRAGTGGSSAAEAAELGRRGLGATDVAALLGFAPAVLPSRVPAVETPPAWLRAELATAAGPEWAARRAELTRRARPFESDGFPVPLDRRRLSAKVLAWSAAAVVLVALGLLVALPTHGSAGAVADAAPLRATAEVTQVAPVEADDDPLPTLAEAPFGASTPAPPTTTPAAPATTRPATPDPTPVATSAPAARPATQADRHARGTGALALSWGPAPGLVCGTDWTAQLHVTTGGVQVTRVVAVAGRGRAAELHPDGDGWSGDLGGLPTDRSTTVAVFADGGTRGVSTRLASNC
ncbi:MAG TPA: hypothetical protein VGP36_25025 [Mycobacteriales bacterium]|nr:hypothetical protein [Mycobacteriales bacterium]